MAAALLACRLALAVTFLVAGLAKLADPVGSRQAAIDFGVPTPLVGTVRWLLPLTEVAVAVALVPIASAPFGAVAGAMLLVCFIAAIAYALAHGRSPDCHCFGQVHSAPAGWRTLLRNAGLLVVAGFVAIGGWSNAGASATHWVTRLSSAWLVASGAGVVIVMLVAFQVWFSLQLLSQNGRTIGRLEALEATIVGIASGSKELAFNGNGHRPALGAGLSGGGLPVGSAAPDFSLDGADGARHSLASLLSGARHLLVIFSDAGCGPCDALMPEIARWQRDHRERLEIALVTSGDEDRNRRKAAEHDLELVLLQPKRKVSDAYQAHATPMAVVIGADAHIASPTVGGAEAIKTLVAQASAPELAIRHVAPSNGDGNQAAAPPRDDPRIGEAAPHLELTEVDGQRVALEDLYEQRTLAIFWNPDCGFCQQMLTDLQAVEQDMPESAPQIVVMSAGDPGQVRELGLRSRVLLDPDAEAMSAFGAGGTPMGVLIEQGRIASPVAAGAEAVFDLFHTAVSQAPEREQEHPQGES